MTKCVDEGGKGVLAVMISMQTKRNSWMKIESVRQRLSYLAIKSFSLRPLAGCWSQIMHSCREKEEGERNRLQKSWKEEEISYGGGSSRKKNNALSRHWEPTSTKADNFSSWLATATVPTVQSLRGANLAKILTM